HAEVVRVTRLPSPALGPMLRPTTGALPDQSDRPKLSLSRLDSGSWLACEDKRRYTELPNDWRSFQCRQGAPIPVDDRRRQPLVYLEYRQDRVRVDNLERCPAYQVA